jgi:sporulation protein YlmC with PRC-barrel domain
MNLQFSILASAVIASTVSLSTWAQPEPTHVRFSIENEVHEFDRIRIKNVQEESLGRVMDLSIDLINGRIVEMLVASDSSLDVGPRIVAVPPRAQISDPLGEVYRLTVSIDVIKFAPAIDLSKWSDAGWCDRVPAAYRTFGQEPYFLEGIDTAGTTANRRKLLFDCVERSSRIVRLLVGNLRNQQFGEVYAMTLDIPKGRIRSFVVLAPGNFETKSIIPAMALSSNDTRNALVLDETNLDYADKPR